MTRILHDREELDREQEAIVENENRGLGLQGEWQGKANWFGGKIQQIAKMEFVPATGSFVIRLEHMQMTRSHRFARFLGSRRILQMKHSGDRRNIALERKFLMQKFVLCGRVFVPFSTKDSKVYLVETTEDYERKATDAQGDGHRLALEEFVQWHNPLAMNQKQVGHYMYPRQHVSLSLPSLSQSGPLALIWVYQQAFPSLDSPPKIFLC